MNPPTWPPTKQTRCGCDACKPPVFLEPDYPESEDE